MPQGKEQPAIRLAGDPRCCPRLRTGHSVAHTCKHRREAFQKHSPLCCPTARPTPPWPTTVTDAAQGPPTLPSQTRQNQHRR